MQYESYGDENGRLLIYFHGAPGSKNEAQFLHQSARQNNLNILCFDRSSIDSDVIGNAYYLMQADTIIKHMESHKSKPEQVDLIGFSIGCHVALEVSLCLANKVASLHLISAAAPLDALDGNNHFLDNMAGKPVFQLAQNIPFLFKWLTFWQGLLTRISPAIVFNMLFASAQGGDKLLTKDIDFKSSMGQILASCFQHSSAGYIKDVLQYVQPWANKVEGSMVSTYLWHGELDNWSPVTMADYLESALPNCKGKYIQAGCSHYSCLLAAVPQICHKIAKE